MYYYIYDTFLSERKYDRDIAAIENRLTDLGLSGKIGRLTPFTNSRGLIRDEVRRGAQTIVVVGNDETMSKVIDGIGEEKVALGLIPVGTPTHIGTSLGIPYGVEACDVLSKRVTQRIDLGKVNGKYFLSDVRIARGRVTIEGEGKYKITSLTQDCEIIVSNLRRSNMVSPEVAAASIDTRLSAAGDPKDGFLDAVIAPRIGGIFNMFRRQQPAPACTVIPLKRLSITSEHPVHVIADGREFTNNNLTFEIVPEKLKVIIGRERIFA